MELPLFPWGGWTHYRICFTGKVFFLVFSLNFPFLISSCDLHRPLFVYVQVSMYLHMEKRSCTHQGLLMYIGFKRVKSAYTECLRENSIYSAPRECQDSEVFCFSGTGYNYCGVMQNF